MITLDAAEIFLAAGHRLASAVVRDRFQEAFLLSRPAVLYLRRCDELLPRDCDNEALRSELGLWLDHVATLPERSPVVVVCSTSVPSNDQLDSVWRDQVDLQLALPSELGSEERRKVLGGYLPSSDPRLGRAVEMSGGFRLCDLRLLGERLLGPGGADPAAVVADMIPMALCHKKADTRGIEAVPWEGVFGQSEAKVALQNASMALMDAEVRRRYAERNVSLPKGILLYGPPGTGKTLLVRALASQCHAHLIVVSIPEIIHATIGETEKSISAIFSRAHRIQPSIIFFDELDALMGGSAEDAMDKFSIQLADELDKISGQVLVIAATNLLDSINARLRCFGRLEIDIYVGLLQPDQQLAMLQCLLPHRPEDQLRSIVGDQLRTGAQVNELAQRNEGHC